MSAQGMSIADSSHHSIGTLLAAVETDLKAAGIDQPALEAAWLLEYVLKLSPLMQRVQPERLVTVDERMNVEAVVARRANREPLQYLLGTQEFCGLEFHVTSSVLIPRPESALLVEETARRCRTNPAATVVDVGTGSGCLAVSVALALPRVRVIAIDVSPEALSVAKRNMAQHRLRDRIECFCGDLLSPLESSLPGTQVDVILSNPPYIEEANWMALQPEVRCFEPRLALAGGPDGITLHRRLMRQAPAFLKPGGSLLMEVGKGQVPLLCRQAEENTRFRVYDILPDHGGIDRVVCLELRNDGKTNENLPTATQMTESLYLS